MADDTLVADGEYIRPHVIRPTLHVGFDHRSAIAFFGILAFGLFFVAYSLHHDVTTTELRARIR
jgi:predicted membrane protein